MLTLAVFISGNGSNLQAIIDAIAADTLDARIACVISNRADAYGLSRARDAGIPTAIIDANEPRFHDPDRATRARLIDQAILDALAPLAIDLCVLAGYMRILSADFIAHYPARILNIHPSLLPAYPGLDTHARVLLARESQHGCTVHLVTPELDAGPILNQRRLDVRPDDTVDTLAQRVHALEHELYPQTIATLTAHPEVIGDVAGMRALFY